MCFYIDWESHANRELHPSANMATLNGSTSDGLGWVDQHYIQLAYQLADSVAGLAYSFVVTCIILGIMNFIPGLSLRASAEHEEAGLDDTQLGEFAYDYVEISRHISEFNRSDNSRESSAEKGIAHSE